MLNAPARRFTALEQWQSLKEGNKCLYAACYDFLLMLTIHPCFSMFFLVSGGFLSARFPIRVFWDDPKLITRGPPLSIQDFAGLACHNVPAALDWPT